MTPIPTYHSINATVPHGFAPWVVSPLRFRTQLAALAASGRRTITVSELARRRAAGETCEESAVLTFDDGFADFLHNALPALRAFDMAATLYVTTGLMGATFHGLPILSWSELREVRDAGIEIGAHSVTHPALDRLPPDRLAAEVHDCKHALEDRLGIAVESFAYPFGYYTRRVREAVLWAGYRSACAVGYAQSRTGDDPFALRRFIVRPNARAVESPPPDAMLYRFRAVTWAKLRQMLPAPQSAHAVADGRSS